ncbi:MAG: prolyl oligopeptidase family serine peptidase [Acidobacteriota bacterium]|nr:prolyl oligopeptidase family serine peptidase [Acidobacteriota bacterium]
MKYPKVRKVEQIDDYHGTKISDPYRWLENTDLPETRAWIEAQNKLTFDYLSKIPERESIERRLTELWNYERYSAPVKRGNRYFFTKNDGLQNQSVLYVSESLSSTPRVLIDPNKLSPDGTVSLSGWSITDDGKLMAYGLASAGSDRTEWRIMNVETGEHLPDVLPPARQNISNWTKDSKGFFYSRFPQEKTGNELRDTSFNQKFYFHRLGTPISEDILIYERPDDKELFVGGRVSDDGRWLILTASKGTARRNMVFFKDLEAKNAAIQPLVEKNEAAFNFIDNIGTKFYFRTDKDAPNGKVVMVDVAEQNKTWREVIPEAKESLGGVNLINNQFVANYLKDAYTQIRIYDREGKFIRNVELPGIGTAGGFGGEREDTETFYTFSSFTMPPTIYRYDMKTGKSEVFRQAKVNFSPANFEVKQVFYTSRDGTRVPMFVAHKKGLKLDGSNPTLLYGYGGFTSAQTPNFSIPNLVWMEMGGVYALANIRGGSEYGKAWHEAGIKLKKQNVFDDFIAAGEWLVANKYTNPSRLAAEGRSNGGLLVGAVVNQRPDLFGAAVPHVGVMDMLRFHKFTIGWAWTSDYGSPENSEEFAAIYKYSPLHNIKPGTKYPAVMITTGDHDDRVAPGHSFKYAATLQEANASDRPILIRIDTKAGHGAGKPIAKLIEEHADKLAFLVRELNFKVTSAK